MAGGLVIADRIKETAAAPGTGNVTLGGAVTGFQTFAGGGCTSNSKIYYGISDGSTKWEVGLGTWVTGPTLQRTTVLASSNAGSLENFTLAITVWGDRPAVMDLLPTQQVLTSGSSATYTTPANCRQIRVRMWGGGGGGGGSGTSGGTSGGNGGDTIFNSINAGGGKADTLATGGAGGSSATGSASLRMQGASGSQPSSVILSATNCQQQGGCGGGFGGGPGGAGGNGGTAGIANTGGGGGSGGIASAAFGTLAVLRGGGGQGEYVEIIINNPAASYTYTIGAGGTAGTAGTSGQAGGAGGTGVIIVDEIYGS